MDPCSTSQGALCELQARTEQAQALFRNPNSTQFVIVTIPTVMAVAESSRLAKALRKESVLVKSLVMNQVSSVVVVPGLVSFSGQT